ncbi:hypothetical protein HG536_0G02280 [Torulaspora globosa]|uniref:RNA exonuclease 4 n=1 Tax=Torulaspora globosa TaxID=48254 RepID=A0A7G3ZLI1_9SACH|nr:uncharacterized protein HG536_0G02280 [Torulaspora globosa]QLL34367.1 hypothetical protein HG536_0G02280 [Torulaspora globosa]
MALSSNWLKLQESEKVSAKDRHSSRKSKKNAAAKPIGTNRKQKQSRIMSMVYSMSREIEKSEQNKREGREFEFKETKTGVGKPDAEGIEHLFGKISGEKATAIGKYLAMDCEFVGVGPEGKESALARVSLVNYYGHVILDEFVKPREKVTDWRTWVSGVRPEHMKDAVPFREIQKKVAGLLQDRILVGHSIKHDLESLLISHPKSSIRDTSRHLPFRQAYAKGKTPSLKKLAKEILKREVQVGEHSPIEDARITMLIYRSDRKEFERLNRARHKSHTGNS